MWLILIAASPLRGAAIAKAGQNSAPLLRREDTLHSAPISNGAATLDVHHIPGGTLLADQLPKASIQSCTNGTDWIHRSCRLRNVCYDVRADHFLWNAGNPTGTPNNTKGGEPIRGSIPTCGDLFSLKAGGPFIQDAVHCLDPQAVSPGQVAVNDSKLAIFRGITALVARRHAPSNAGHFLMQTATALERLANDYSVTSAAERIVLFADACSTLKEPDPAPPFREEMCLQFTHDFASPLSVHELIDLPDVQKASFLGNKLANFDYLCFEDALGGIGGHSPFDGNNWGTMAQWVSPYREKVYVHHLLEASKPRNGCNIVFVRKDGIHGFHPVGNQDEVDATLRTWAREHQWAYESMNLRNRSFHTQLQTLQRADIMVTVPGSAAFSAFFILPGAHMVYLAEDNYESGVLKLSSEYRTHFITQVPPKIGSADAKLANSYDYGANAARDDPGFITPEVLTAKLEEIATDRGCKHG